RHPYRRDRLAQALQGRRARGEGRLRVRHVAQELLRHQGEGPVRSVRSAGGRSNAVKRAAGRNAGRPQRLGDLIQRELSELLQRELRDPRVGMITITAVDVSPDFSHAKVLYTTLDPAHVEEAAKGLKRAAGFLRSQLARRIKLYTTPELRFEYDVSVERGDRLSRLIDSTRN